MTSVSSGGYKKGDASQSSHDESSGEVLLSDVFVLQMDGSQSFILFLPVYAGVFTEVTAEVGTIAGIVSAVGMALVGAITSYISYQKKKLCFSIQRKVPH